MTCPAAQLKAATHKHRNLGVWVLPGYHGCGVENMTDEVKCLSWCAIATYCKANYSSKLNL